MKTGLGVRQVIEISPFDRAHIRLPIDVL